ncbi:MAG: hypothetical protein DRQ52_04920 [Gammaproteobacteria bacterium]|nr:MAG: hypothetical protein DRQ52_04920 [Gammaproteobacteria bacterium]
MTWLLAILREQAQQQPDKIALCTSSVTTGSDLVGSISYAALLTRVELATDWLSGLTGAFGQPAERIGLLLDNSPAWALLDIACMSVNKTLIPIPAFFSPTQITGLLVDAGIDLLLTDQPERIKALGDVGQAWAVAETRSIAGRLISCLAPKETGIAPRLRCPLPADTVKITYTSGSTGDPKGVCLSNESLRRVATELTATMNIDSSYHHLCLLPLAVLLENVAGLYVALLAGATCRLEPLASLGWRGMTDFKFSQLAAVLLEQPVDSLILVPELLTGLLTVAQQQPDSVKSLRLVAVGGAAVPAGELAAAERLGLPVYQGYGLSECGSVVAVNCPVNNRAGSVGKPLPHQRLKIADDGQIWIGGQGVSPYLGREQEVDDGWWATGDRGHLDDNGYLYIEGRYDNLLLTSFGRNVSPEWVELLLVDQPVIQQAVLLGGGQRQLKALLVVAAETSDQQIEQALVAVNQDLPDYARVSQWRRNEQRLTLANGLLTRGGLPNRVAVADFYRQLPLSDDNPVVNRGVSHA